MVLAKLGSENETNRHECQREICGEEGEESVGKTYICETVKIFKHIKRI